MPISEDVELIRKYINESVWYESEKPKRDALVRILKALDEFYNPVVTSCRIFHKWDKWNDVWYAGLSRSE